MHFLIVKTSSLGDILHAFPALSYLRKKFPNAQIDWIVEKPFSDLLSSHPEVDNVITVDTKKWRKNFLKQKEIRQFLKILRKKKYDAVFDLQGNIKSSLILAFARAKEKVGFGRKTVHEWPNLFFTSFKVNLPDTINIREDNLFLLKKYFQDPLVYEESRVILNISDEQKEVLDKILKNKGDHLVLVCPGAFWPNKQVNETTLIAALKKIENNPSFFFAWGNDKEKEFANTLALSFLRGEVLPKLSLPLLQNLMSRVDLVIAMDSLPLHLAGTTNTKTFSFFGPSLGNKFAPIGINHHFFQGKCPYQLTFKKRCPQLRTCKTGACLKEINLENVSMDR